MTEFTTILPVTDDPDLYYQIRRAMMQFPGAFSEAEKKAYGVLPVYINERILDKNRRGTDI